MINRTPPSEEEFYRRLRSALQRAQTLTSTRRLIYLLDLSKSALGKIFTGSKTNAKVPWDATLADPTALDEIAALYGLAIVPAEPEVDFADLRILLAKVQLALAETPDPTHQDYLKHEALFRELRSASTNWIERCRAHRRPSGEGK